MRAASAAALAAASCVALLPAGLLWLAPVAAAVVALPAWPALFPMARKRDAVFVPDPLAPDFRALAATVREMLEAARAEGVAGRIVLTPMPSQAGGFAEYSLLWNPAGSAIEVSWSGGTVRLKTAAPVMADAPMPLTVSRCAAAVEIRRDVRTGRAVLRLVRTAPASWLGCAGAPDARKTAWLAYLAALAFAAAPDRGIGWARAAVLAVAPILAQRLADFSPRIASRVSSEVAFAKNLARRFFGKQG